MVVLTVMIIFIVIIIIIILYYCNNKSRVAFTFVPMKWATSKVPEKMD